MKKFFQRSREVFLNVMRNIAIDFLWVCIAVYALAILAPLFLLGVWLSVQMFHMVVAAL